MNYRKIIIIVPVIQCTKGSTHYLVFQHGNEKPEAKA